MKIILPLLLLVLLVEETGAQESRHSVSLLVQGGGTKMSGLNAIGYGSIGVDWQITRTLSVGPTVHVMGFAGIDGIAVPITGDISYKPFRSKVQPFANLQIGKTQYSHTIDLSFDPFNPPDKWKTTGGIYVSPNVGVTFPIFTNINLLATVGYMYTKFRSRFTVTSGSNVTQNNRDFTDQAPKGTIGFSLRL